MVTHYTTELARFCAELQGAALPATLRERVRYLLLDHLAVTIGGSSLPSSQAAYRFLATLPGSHPANGVTIFGRPERAEASWAALVNGTAAHGLEMDDVENRSSLHPGVAVFPAALALSEQLNSSLDDFYASIVAGYEVTLRVGAALNPAAAYERGFHPTAICGTLGATACCARLLGLTAEQTEEALGIAGSMASGSLAYLHNGAWTKRLNPGWSSHAGISAARLAAAGFTGPNAILEGRYGFLHAYSPDSDARQLTPDNTFAIMEVALKPYACCRYMHGPIDCLLDIRRNHEFTAEQITRVDCGVLTGGWGLVADPIEQKRAASNIVEAQFSMPYAASVALLTGQAGQTVFSERYLHNSAVRALMQRVDCYASPELDAYYPQEWRASARVELHDGRKLSATIRYPLGDPHNPLSWEQLEARFHELVAPIIPNQRQRQRIIDNVRNLHTPAHILD
ncbi:MAG: MmgE/PrpD family protein [Ktedonobacteraceae bacterium]|nr:MmgE/PrpD family protein [Ktedonobacteraceae bacterium]MBO0795513.1 MmgE/PrpD family protein [Ktedonobacteraceae bacterium]